MKDIYLREPERPFKLWNWLMFGVLFLLAINFVAFWLDSFAVTQIGIVLGYVITVRMMGMKKLTWLARLMGSIGLTVAISSIASVCLWGFCKIQPSLELCTPNHLGANVLGNFVFPLIVVMVWVASEIFGSLWKTISYVIRYWKR